ncbi:MAG: transporter substrate-binding domain-containing protein, partial [Chitinivibrionales bacterium]|nr:transporter substrate-binding domain-containing protein [Chitinivibrionales bacterium]
KTGYLIVMLRELEKTTPLKFDIKIKPYSRGKVELREGAIQIVGPTPKNAESKDFYTYAQELDWEIKTCTDIYATNPSNLNLATYKTKRIGTTIGNKEFLSQMFEIPKNNLTEGELHSLMRLLSNGRLDIVLFERATIMSTIEADKISNVQYKMLSVIPCSIALRKDAQGDNLKKMIDEGIKKLDMNKIYGLYFKYVSMPDSGHVAY